MVKFSDYFNSTTLKGRANVAKATYASIAAIYVYSRLKKSKKVDQHPKDGQKSGEHDHGNHEHGHGPDAHSPEAKGNYSCPRCECKKESNGHEQAVAHGGGANPGASHGHTDSSSKADGHGHQHQHQPSASAKLHDNGAANSCQGSHGGH